MRYTFIYTRQGGWAVWKWRQLKQRDHPEGWPAGECRDDQSRRRVWCPYLPDRALALATRAMTSSPRPSLCSLVTLHIRRAFISLFQK